jgi:hypothetical protein
VTAIMNRPLDEKALRKIWLKKKFASWEYHEELLKLHDEYLTALHEHWAKLDIQKRFPDEAETMRTPVFFNFDRVQKPGEIAKSEWNAKPTVGWADAISYNFNRGLDFANCDIYAGMLTSERDRLNVVAGLVLRRCQNIKYTVDYRWIFEGSDDSLLDESYTGPIVWPANWRDEVAGCGASGGPLRCEAGQPCPREGFWFTPAKTSSRRYFHAGEVMPDVGGDYGATIWQWDQLQT